MAQNGPTDLENLSKMIQNGASMVPKWSHDGRTWAQEGIQEGLGRLSSSESADLKNTSHFTIWNDGRKLQDEGSNPPKMVLGIQIQTNLGMWEPTWTNLGPSWSILRPSWGNLGTILRHLRAKLGHIGPSWPYVGISPPYLGIAKRGSLGYLAFLG